MKILAAVLVAIAGIASLFVLRIAVKSYLGERSDFQRNPPTELARHPERAAVAGLREISFGKPGGPRIAGWYAPAANRAAVILVHGTDAERTAVILETRLLAQGGFGVLALDLPGQGASEGHSLWGGPERAAISAAVDWLQVQPDVDSRRIGALGLSMGAYVLAQAAVLDPRIGAVVLAAAPSDVVEQNWRASSRWGWISQLPTDWALRASGMPLDMRPKDIAGSIAPRPLLIIGGELDDLVPPDMARQIYAAAREPKELWIVPGAHHVDYGAVAPQEYRRRLLEFFTRTLCAS